MGHGRRQGWGRRGCCADQEVGLPVEASGEGRDFLARQRNGPPEGLGLEGPSVGPHISVCTLLHLRGLQERCVRCPGLGLSLCPSLTVIMSSPLGP